MITAEQLELHQKSLLNEPGGIRLVAIGADLRGIYLHGADIRSAVLLRSDLRGVDFSGADLRNADFWGADLEGANLKNANLQGANLEKASLKGANLQNASLLSANLRCADLQCADMRSANVEGANLQRADFFGANLLGVKGLPIADDAPSRLQAVATTVLAAPKALSMSVWHTSDVVHSLAGWAIHQAGPIGATLEKLHGPDLAGLLLLGAEAASHFYDSDEDALKWLRSIHA